MTTHDVPIDRGPLRACLLIALCCFLIYNSNLRSISAGDTYPARYLPFAIVGYHTVFLDPVERVAAQGRGAGAYWMMHRPDGHILSLYPLAVPVLIAPLYVPAVAWLHLRGWTDARLDHVARVMEKLTASLIAALSAALLFLLLRRRADTKIALLLTAAYAFGTTTWVVSSQALWQHGMGELLVIATLLFLTASCTTPRTIAAGLLLGLIAANRPPDAILAAAMGVCALYWAGKRLAPLLMVSAAIPMIPLLLYNLTATGNPLGAYGAVGGITFFQHDLLTGIAGLLVSPTRGILVYSPFLLFVPLAWRYLPRNPEERRLLVMMSGAIVLQVLLYAKTDWRAGLSWGPRYLTDLLPFLIWMLVPVVVALRGVLKVCFLFTIAVAIGLEALGAFAYSFSLDLPIYAADLDTVRQDMRAAFRWRNASFVACWREGLAPAELTVAMRGSLDAVESNGQAIKVITAGQPADVVGWALGGDATPLRVAVNIDGRQTIVTDTFFDRPDVRATLGASSPSGWRIPLDTAGLTPGEHRLTAFGWPAGKREGQFLEERRITVRASQGGATNATETPADTPADLERDARTAALRIREHQQAAGYWLTAYTSEPRFHDPHAEMNTFMTAFLIDLLTPLAGGDGLEENVQRARRHLTGQIESTGLVRYHGLPNGPGIGTLGCAITPDTDDTALVWRVAPDRDRTRLTAALETIDRYRTSAGLYRTWLAPREEFQCLDPGRDPNPADFVIQMHLLMLLSDVRPAAARGLCDALRLGVDDDRVWVYYRKTPLVPTLRIADLRRAGCTVELPASRMRSIIPDQGIWLSVVRLVAPGNGTAESTPDPVLMRAVLRELARDDFALIRVNPPLLYHNDLTATVSRYYWSEDAGYALWLRLYEQYSRHDRPH